MDGYEQSDSTNDSASTPESAGDARPIPLAKGHRDLTAGPVSRSLLLLAPPLMLSHAVQTSFGLVDTFWVGKLSPSAVAALTMSGHIIFLLMTVLAGVSTGTMVLVARAVGAKDRVAASRAAEQALLLTFIIAALMGILGFVFAPHILSQLTTDAETLELGTGYMRVMFVGIFTLVALYMVSAIMQGAGDASTPMKLVVGAAIANFFIDPMLIFGVVFPKLGVTGAAWSTVFTRGGAGVIGLLLLLRGRPAIRIRTILPRLDPQLMMRMVRIGLPTSVMVVLHQVIGLIMIVIVSRYFGTHAMAGYGIGMRIHSLAWMPTFGLAIAAGTLVGQNLGANKPDRAERSGYLGAAWCTAVMFVMALIAFVFAPLLVATFNNDPNVVEIGTSFLRFTALALVFSGVWIGFSRSLSGAGDTVTPLKIAVVSAIIHVCVAVGLSATIGLEGVWISFLVGDCVGMILAAVCFRRGKWKYKKV